jgi:hypothetical protein
MHIKAVFGLIIAISASAFDGFFYDMARFTPEVLDNIDKSPYCAHSCISTEEYPPRFAPECRGLDGKEFGACLCKANGYQYMLDQCYTLMKCNSKERKTVNPFSPRD